MDTSQESLKVMWHSAAPGRLTPWQQSLALGLREASKEVYGGHVYVSWIASRLRKTDCTGKAYSEEAPKHSSLVEFFHKVDADPSWFPGKHCGTKRGPPPLMTKAKRARIASPGMRQKDEGHEPAVEVTLADCPVSTINPKTGKPFCEKTIRKVWMEDCYDFDPSHPWKMQLPLQKNFLPDDIKEHRLAMVRAILQTQEHGDSVSWWARNVVWMDPCASILPRSRRQYDKMRRAEIGNKKRLISDDARMYSRNLKGPKESLKQCGFESERISWLIVLARGTVAVEMLPEDWVVDGAGMASAVQRVPQILRNMLGDAALLPRVLFTDRGTGMYVPNGHVTHHYADAVSKAGLRLYWGANAKQQAPDMGDMLLHETAVSWFRSKMKREKPVVLPWEETREQWEARATRCVQAINEEYDVAGLCRAFPARMLECQEKAGDKLRT